MILKAFSVLEDEFTLQPSFLFTINQVKISNLG